MEGVESQQCVFLGIKVKPGPIERHKLENFTLENTVERLRNEAEKKANLPSASLELIHHGKILKDNTTLVDNGVKSGEMVHVVKKKVQPPPAPPTNYTDAELQMLNNSLRTLGCTPNAVGWTRAMQLLNDESAMAEIIEHAPSLAEDCMTLSILHEVELLAALGANLQTMRRGAEAHPDLPNALRHLMRLVGLRANFPAPTPDPAPTSGFAYSLEALSEDEDAEEEEAEEGEGRSAITQEQLAAALQAATEAVLSSSSRSAGGAGGSGGGGAQGRLLALLQATSDAEAAPASPADAAPRTPAASRERITVEMFSSAISAALTRAQATGAPTAQSAAAGAPTAQSAAAGAPTAQSAAAGTPMAQSVAANTAMAQSAASSSSSQSPAPRDDFSAQLQRMHEMGLLDDALNVRALLICAGDVNAAINLVFSGAIGDD